MKVLIDILKIHCSRTTRDELNPDDIYVATFLSTLKKKDKGVESTLDDEKPLWGKVSDVESPVKKGHTWIPAANHFEINIGDDTEVIGLKLGLYERDNGRLFDRMRSELTGLVKPDGFDLDTVVLPDELGLVSVVKFLFGLFKKAIIHFGQDDLLGDAEVIVPIATLAGDTFPREFEFKRHGGKYELSMRVRVEA